MNTLRHTKEFREWLAQFDVEDRQFATILAESLDIVTDNRLAYALRSQTFELLDKVEGRIAIYSCRKVKEGDGIFLPGRKGRLAPRPGNPQGSEDQIGLFVRQLVRAARHNRRLLDHPGLASLRSNCVHNIVLWDDGVGSGDRVSSYIAAFCNHPTIRSWWSLGYLRFHVVTYSCSETARLKIPEGLPGSSRPFRARLFDRSSRLHLHYRKRVGADHWQEFWPKALVSDLRQLCEKYGERHGMRFPLGYGKVMSNVVFQRSCPNNVPGVVFETAGSWQPLIGRSPSPEFIEELGDNSETQRLLAIERAVKGEYPVAVGREIRFRNPKLLLALCAIGRGQHSQAKVASTIGVSPTAATDLIKLALKYQFVKTSPRLSLTDGGRAELKAIRKRLRKRC